MRPSAWVGVEVEGPLTGTRTLFVGGLVDADTVERLAREHAVDAVYFGAGRCADYDPGAVDRAASLALHVTVELRAPRDGSDLREETRRAIRAAIVTTTAVRSWKQSWCKVEYAEHGALEVFELSQSMSLDPDDPLVAGDVLVWQS